MVTGKKAFHQPRPPALPQHFSEDGKTRQQRTFDILVNQPPIYFRTPGLNTGRAGIYPGITDMRGKSVLEALELEHQFGQGLMRRAKLESAQYARLHASIRSEEEY